MSSRVHSRMLREIGTAALRSMTARTKLVISFGSEVSVTTTPSVNGQTSVMITSFNAPSRSASPACTAAPSATAVSGSMAIRGERPNMRATRARTIGSRVEPPTSTIRSKLSGFSFASTTAPLERSAEPPQQAGAIRLECLARNRAVVSPLIDAERERRLVRGRRD